MASLSKNPENVAMMRKLHEGLARPATGDVGQALSLDEALAFFRAQELAIQKPVQAMVQDLMNIARENAAFFEKMRERVQNNVLLATEMNAVIDNARGRMRQLFDELPPADAAEAE